MHPQPAAQRPPPPVRWGIGDAVRGLVLAQLLTIVASVVVLVGLGYVEDGRIREIPLGVVALLQVPLWAGYGGVAIWASLRKGNGPVADFGWAFRPRDLPAGLAAGIGTQFIVVPAIYLPLFRLIGERDVSEAARSLTGMATGGLEIALLVLVVVVGAPVVEELFFRGLLLRSLQHRFGTLPAALGSSLVFGLIHFQLLQLPALVAFGLVAAWLTLRTGRLGPAIWAHVGFNGVTVAVLLATS